MENILDLIDHVTVPVEPTERMLSAAYLALESEGIVTTTWMRETIYLEMIRVAAEEQTSNLELTGRAAQAEK